MSDKIRVKNDFFVRKILLVLGIIMIIGGFIEIIKTWPSFNPVLILLIICPVIGIHLVLRT